MVLTYGESLCKQNAHMSCDVNNAYVILKVRVLLGLYAHVCKECLEFHDRHARLIIIITEVVVRQYFYISLLSTKITTAICSKIA